MSAFRIGWASLLLVVLTSGCASMGRRSEAVVAAATMPQQEVREEVIAANVPDRQQTESGSTAGTESSPVSNRGTPGTEGAVYNLLPFLSLATASNRTGANPYGAYTRFYAENRRKSIGNVSTSDSPVTECKKDNTTQRCYADEHRSGLVRFFSDKELSRILSVKVTLKNPALETTTTLASATYKGVDNKGQEWSTEINGQMYLTPYFRIDSNSVARIDAGINATTVSKEQVSGKVLTILQGALQLAAPTSAILTTLTSQRFSQVSQFTGQSLSSLFSNQLVEKSSNDFTPDQWLDGVKGNISILTITGNFPLSGDVSDRKTFRFGAWDIKASDPVISVFNAVPVSRPECGAELDCVAKAAFVALAPSHVMNFRVTDDATLRQVLKADTGVSDALERLTKKSANIGEEARAVCNKIDDRMQAIGFNRYDAAAGVWAFSHDLTQIHAKAMLSDASCPAAKLARSVGLGS